MLDKVLGRPTAPAWFFLLLFTVYALTAHHGGNVVNDVHSAAHAAWSLATRGTLDLSQLDLPYDQAWSVPVGDALYSNRFPGVILSGVPFYLLLQPSQPVVYPSALGAALSAATGVTLLLLALRRLVPTRWAWASAATLGLGTAVWAVAADGLWSHGATVLWLGLTTWGLTAAGWRRAATVLGAAMAVVSRPHLGVALAVAAVVLWRRDRLGALVLAVGGLLGAGAFLVYGRLLFGEWSVMGPYTVYDFDRAVEEESTELGGETAWRLENLALAFVSPRVGLLPAYPAVLVALWALWALRGRWRLPPVPLALTLGGLGYLLVSAALTRVSGGSGFWGNRTLVETVVLTWPLLTHLVAGHHGGRVWRALLAVGVGWSVFFHSLGALSPSPAASGDGSTTMFWQVPSGLREAAPWQLAVVAGLSAVTALLLWRLTARAATSADGPVPLPPAAGRPAALSR